MKEYVYTRLPTNNTAPDSTYKYSKDPYIFQQHTQFIDTVTNKAQ